MRGPECQTPAADIDHRAKGAPVIGAVVLGQLKIAAVGEAGISNQLPAIHLFAERDVRTGSDDGAAPAIGDTERVGVVAGALLDVRLNADAADVHADRVVGRMQAGEHGDATRLAVPRHAVGEEVTQKLGFRVC
jgi:hypothetical protein